LMNLHFDEPALHLLYSTPYSSMTSTHPLFPAIDFLHYASVRTLLKGFLALHMESLPNYYHHYAC